MQYVDPSLVYRFEHPPHWVFNPVDSTFSHAVFDNFRDTARHLTVSLTPGGLAKPAEWLAAVSESLWRPEDTSARRCRASVKRWRSGGTWRRTTPNN